MTWLSDKVMLTRAVLLREILRPKNKPIVSRPFHCRDRVSLCLWKGAKSFKALFKPIQVKQ